MLQIRLSKPTKEGGGTGAGGGGGSGGKPLPADSVTVACPDHLVLADLPVAKSIGPTNPNSIVKSVGRRSRRSLGERVHFCISCDFPISIYGRLSPCEHAFCLDCARSDSLCYLCDERVQKIQTIKMMEGIYICAAPLCFKSFLKKNEFASHIYSAHADILNSNADKNGNDSEAASARKPTASESTVQAPLRPIFSPGSNTQPPDREDKAHRPPVRDQPPPRPLMQLNPTLPPFPVQSQNHLSEQQVDSNLGPQNCFPQQTFDPQVGLRSDSSQLPDKQQGLRSESPFPEYPMHAHQPQNFAVPVNSNPVLVPPQLGYPPFAPEGAVPFYGAPHEMARPDVIQEAGSEQGSLLGFPPGGLMGGVNFAESYPRPWNMGPAGGQVEPSPAGQGNQDGFMNVPHPQGRPAFFQGDYQNPAGLPSNHPPPHANKAMEQVQGGMTVDPRDGKGVLAPQPMHLPPPPPLQPPHMSQHKRKFYPGDVNRDGHGYGWQREKRENFGSGQE